MKSIEQQVIFTHLKGKVFAEFNIVYHINDGYAIKRLTDIQSKHQLLFQKFGSKIQQMNLMLVDSLFPIHLADAALETFLNGVSSFREYTFLKKDFIVIDTKMDVKFFRKKFFDFFLLLLYSNIASEVVCKGEFQSDHVYYLKNRSNEIYYYSIYEQRELQEMLFEKLLLEIDLNKSSISKQETNLCFRISFRN
jgi:hypothetical protein